MNARNASGEQSSSGFVTTMTGSAGGPEALRATAKIYLAPRETGWLNARSVTVPRGCRRRPLRRQRAPKAHRKSTKRWRTGGNDGSHRTEKALVRATFLC